MNRALRLIGKGDSLSAVSRLCNVPRRTLSRYQSKKQDGNEAVNISVQKMGRKKTFNEDEERELVQKINSLSEVGCPLTSAILRRLVFEFAESKKCAHNFNQETKEAGTEWFRVFCKRHPNLSIPKAQKLNMTKAKTLNRAFVDYYFTKLKAALDENQLKDDPVRIFSLDEKGCQLNLDKEQYRIVQRRDRVHVLGDNVTVVACANASGHVIPPMILFKGNLVKSTYSDGLPHGSMVATAPEGSLTPELFELWLDHFAKSKPAGKILLIMNGTKCHISLSIAEKAERLEIVLFCVPSKPELQPLNKSLFRSYEHHWDATLKAFWNQNPNVTLNEERFSDVLTPVWEKSLSVSNIVDGFRSTGIFPFDPSVLILEPAQVTEAGELNRVNSESVDGTEHRGIK